MTVGAEGGMHLQAQELGHQEQEEAGGEFLPRASGRSLTLPTAPSQTLEKISFC